MTVKLFLLYANFSRCNFAKQIKNNNGMKKCMLIIGIMISFFATDATAEKTEVSDVTCLSGVLPRNARVMKPTRSEVRFKDVTLTKYGTLASVLGDEINDIDSLVVRGPIDDVDFHTMWSSSFYGGLTVINLEYATIKDNRLPKNAFWYHSEQYTPGG